MTRKEKYPDTSTFHFYNANPKNRFTTDCVVRALSTALNLPYKQVLYELTDLQCETGYDAGETTLISKYLQNKGWQKQKQPRKEDNTKYTGKEFCKTLQTRACSFPVSSSGRYVANIGGHHIVAIVDDKVWDTWNSTNGCIGNYWTA